MFSSLSQKQRDEIQSQLKFEREIAQIVHNIEINRSQIVKMNKNLTRYKIVITSKQIRDALKRMNEKMKTHLLQWIDFHSINYLNEMCWFIYDHYDVEINEQIMCKTLKRFKWIHKKINILIIRNFLLIIVKLHIELYIEINLSVTFDESKYAIESLINSYFLTKSSHANVQTTKSIIEFNMTRKQWFMLCLKDLKNNLYYQHIRRKTTSFDVFIMTSLLKKYSTISCYTRFSLYAFQSFMKKSTLFLYATTFSHTNRWNWERYVLKSM